MNVVLPLLILTTLVAAPSGTGTLEGRWVLVEQTYEQGSNNLADGERPLHLELRPGPQGWGGRIWAGDDEAGALPWPAFRAGRAPAPPRIVERNEDPAGREIAVRYRVAVEPESGFEIEVTETYRLADDGTLAGTMKVLFLTPDGERGSYRLFRRFERSR